MQNWLHGWLCWYLAFRATTCTTGRAAPLASQLSELMAALLAAA